MSLNLLTQISEMLNSIQSELKCGICQSTFREPVFTECHHSFCKGCLEGFYTRTRQEKTNVSTNRHLTMGCPLCRHTLNRRNWKTEASQHQDCVQFYLQMAKGFKRDVTRKKVVIPKECAFAESQAIVATQSVDSPLLQFKFKQPLPPTVTRKRKFAGVRSIAAKVARLDAIAEDAAEESPKKSDDARDVFAMPNLPPNKPPTARALAPPKLTPEIPQTNIAPPAVPARETTSVAVQCEPISIYSIVTDKSTSFRETLRTYTESRSSQSTQFASELDALLSFIPDIRDILFENLNRLTDLLPLTVATEQPTSSIAARLSTVFVPVSSTPTSSQSDVMAPAKPANSTRLTSSAMKRGNSACASVPIRSRDPDEPPILKAMPRVKSEEMLSNDGDDLTDEMPQVLMSRSGPFLNIDDNLLLEFTNVVGRRVKVATRRERLARRPYILVVADSEGDRLTHRSMDFLFAVASKSTVVSRRWMEECVAQGELLDTSNYPVQHNTIAVGREPWLFARGATSNLLSGWLLYIPARFCDSKYLSREDLIMLAREAGARVTDRMWELHSTRCVVLFMVESTEKTSAHRIEADTKATVVTADWLMESIASYTVKPLEGYRVARPRSTTTA